MKPSALTFRMTERQWRKAIMDHIIAHPGIGLAALMSAVPQPKVKPACHLVYGYVLDDMINNKVIIEIRSNDRHRPYTIRCNYYLA